MEKNELLDWLKTIVIAVIIAVVIKGFIFETVKVSGSSMEPTLNNGDGIVISKMDYRISKPKKGDIVVFKYPLDPTQNFVKRIIAVENQRVKVEDNRVYVDDIELNEPYAIYGHDKDFSEAIVPKDMVFVLGDNRPLSKDSRYEEVGFIPSSNLVGKAVLRFWPFTKLSIFVFR